jgi:hypothetical protein
MSDQRTVLTFTVSQTVAMLKQHLAKTLGLDPEVLKFEDNTSVPTGLTVSFPTMALADKAIGVKSNRPALPPQVFYLLDGLPIGSSMAVNASFTLRGPADPGAYAWFPDSGLWGPFETQKQAQDFINFRQEIS